MKKSFDVVYVKWDDAVSGSTDWTSMSDTLDWDDDCSSIGHHIGFVLYETDEYVLLVADIMPMTKDLSLADTNTFSPFRIPKAWILDRILLGTFHLKKGFKSVK